MPGPTLQNPVLQKSLRRRSTAGTGQKCFSLICLWTSSQGQEHQCPLGRLRMGMGTRCRSCSISLWDATTGQRDSHICVSMTPGIQPDSSLQCSNRERATAQLVLGLEQRARREAGTIPGSFLTQKRHLSTHWPKLFTTGHLSATANSSWWLQNKSIAAQTASTAKQTGCRGRVCVCTHCTPLGS